jgi:hypothetical protein
VHKNVIVKDLFELRLWSSFLHVPDKCTQITISECCNNFGADARYIIRYVSSCP